MDNELASIARVGDAASRPLHPGWIRARFATTDGGAGGPWPTLLRAVKFAARCAWNAGTIVEVERGLRGVGLGRLLDADATIALRPLRSYVCAAFDAPRRAALVNQHYRWLTQAMPASIVDLLQGGGRVVLYRGSGDAAALEIALTHAQALVREGELALQLRWQGRPVMALAFSAGRSGVGGRRFLVGAVQGVRGEESALREIAAASSRLRPTALLIVALQGLGEAALFGPALAVASGAHVYAGYSSARRRVGIDYDRVWADAGAARIDADWWQLPERTALRPDAAVASRRRAGQRRRNALRQALHEAVAEAATWQLFALPDAAVPVGLAPAPRPCAADNRRHGDYTAAL